STPIGEMVDAMRSADAGPQRSEFALTWPATPDQIYAALSRVVSRAATPIRSPFTQATLVGEPSLADWAPRLRPIGATMVARGLTTSVEDGLRAALTDTPLLTLTTPGQAMAPRALRPGDPIGMSFVRGDLEMGSTGTVTHIDGAQVYAFGHAFLSQGP